MILSCCSFVLWFVRAFLFCAVVCWPYMLLSFPSVVLLFFRPFFLCTVISWCFCVWCFVRGFIMVWFCSCIIVLVCSCILLFLDGFALFFCFYNTMLCLFVWSCISLSGLFLCSFIRLVFSFVLWCTWHVIPLFCFAVALLFFWDCMRCPCVRLLVY